MVFQPQHMGGHMGKVGGKSPFMQGQRRALNLAAIIISLFAPWGIFAFTFSLMSFSLRFTHPPLCYLLVALALLLVCAFGLLAVDTVKKNRAGDINREPSWYIFLFVTSLIAWIMAVLIGDLNFWTYMQPFYDVNNLQSYPSVDPARVRGQQVMDAGKIIFAEGSKLDRTKSMGFKNVDYYCVAPISKGNASLATYDFWAVGLNCCAGSEPDFHCGEYNNPRANAGLRLMRDDQRGFFRLAVQQAEATYNIKAIHPLFFYWMQDPISEMLAYQAEGYKFCAMGIFTHFAWQIFAVIVAVVAFSKIGSF